MLRIGIKVVVDILKYIEGSSKDVFPYYFQTNHSDLNRSYSLNSNGGPT